YIKNTLVPAYAAQGKHVTTVDQYSNFATPVTGGDPALYSNGINHPNATGYDKMAQTWFTGFQSLNLPPTPAALTTLVSNGSFETPIFANNTHNIQPSGASWTFTAGVAGAGSGIDHGDA